MFGITGATGELGQLVIDELLKSGVKGQDIAVLVRNPEKAKNYTAKGIQVRVANYDEPKTLESALKGIDRLLLISSSEVGKRFPQHKAVIDAAIKNNVSFVAYTSLLKADTSKMELAKEHLETENYFKASGLNYTLLRNSWYTENYTMSAKSAIEHGTVFGTAANAKISAAPRRDYALAAVKVLTEKGHEGKVYELAGDTAFTLSEYAGLLSELTHKKIAYNNLSEAEFHKLLVQIGLPDGLAFILADSEAKARDYDALYDNSGTLSKLIGRKTVTLLETLKASL
jgi:NAD(P)H dehydrogenase (quinone)